MVLAAFLVAFVVTPIAFGLVYLDGIQRGLAQRTRLQWALIVGLISFNGFLLPHLFENTFNHAYFQDIKSAPIVTFPFEVLALHLIIGISISTVSVLLYRLGIQLVSVAQAED